MHGAMLLILIAFSLGMQAAPTPPAPDPRPDLEAATAAARWIHATATPTEHGIVWPMDPDDQRTTVRHLYSGTPGVVLFFIELSRASGDPSWLDRARRGGDDLIAACDAAPADADPGLWTGRAGQAFTLQQLAAATGDQRYLDAARRIVRRLHETARPLPEASGVRWNATTDIISGAAGVGLFLLHAHRTGLDPEGLTLAVKVGDGLLSAARPIESEDAPMFEWPMTPDFPRLMPNFSHGTAGVAYFLATLHQAAHDAGLDIDDRFLDGARAGARHLQHIANTTDEGCLIHHHTPGGEDLYYLGWCHGPVGTSRLYRRLASVDPDGAWQAWADRLTASLDASGIPERRTPGFWENVGTCCGSAGVALHYLRRHGARTTPSPDLTRAQRFRADIMRRATQVTLDDGTIGLKWVQAEPRVRPDFLVAQTGYMQGAAGIGLTLLRFDAHATGRPFGLHLPDEIQP